LNGLSNVISKVSNSLDTNDDLHHLEDALKARKLKLLQLTSVDVIKVTFHKRARGLVLMESDMCSDEYRRIGIFCVNDGAYFDDVDPQVIKIV
jgi:hypothetical protein